MGMVRASEEIDILLIKVITKSNKSEKVTNRIVYCSDGGVLTRGKPCENSYF